MSSTRRRILLLLSLLAAGVAAQACKSRSDVDAHYTTRGLVKRFEGSGDDARVEIHHERIAEFKDRDGNSSPMDSMAMSFALGPGVDAAIFEPGAKLTLEFDVRWSNSAPLLITRAERLSGDTELVLSDH